jgi:hypothetical protein
MDTGIPAPETAAAGASVLAFLKYLRYNDLQISRLGCQLASTVLSSMCVARSARQMEDSMSKLWTMIALCALAIASPVAAQGRDRDKGSDDIPPGYRPPPGMCRVWVDGVPPGQQPAPTDCRTAIRNRPPNGRVIFGDDYAKSLRGDKSKLPELLKEFRREKEDGDRKDDEKSDKRKRPRKP